MKYPLSALIVFLSLPAVLPGAEVLTYTLSAFGRPVGKVTLSLEDIRLRTSLGVKAGNIAQMTQRLVTVRADDGRLKREEVRTVLNGRIRSGLLVCTNGEARETRSVPARTTVYRLPKDGSFFTFSSFLCSLYEDRLKTNRPYPVLLGGRMLEFEVLRPCSGKVSLQSRDESVSVDSDISLIADPSGTVRLVPERIRLERCVYRGINWNFLRLDLEKREVRAQ